MPFIEWDDSLSVGVAEIDAQHKKEAELLNELHEAKGEDVVKLFKQLAEHTVMHFATEEKYFDEFGYEDAVAHKAEHKKFLDKAAELQKQVESGHELSEDTFDFIKEWLVNHIRSMDQKYTSCFNEHGLH